MFQKSKPWDGAGLRQRGFERLVSGKRARLGRRARLVWYHASAAPGCPRASFSDGKAILSCASKGQPNRALGLGCADLPANLVLFFLIAGLATLDLCVDFRATGLDWVIAEILASGSSALLGTSVWSLFKRIGPQGATAPAKVDGRETATTTWRAHMLRYGRPSGPTSCRTFVSISDRQLRQAPARSLPSQRHV